LWSGDGRTTAAVVRGDPFHLSSALPAAGIAGGIAAERGAPRVAAGAARPARLRFRRA
jgi:hypothetical protein